MNHDARYFWAAVLLMLPLLIVGQNHGLWNRSEAREVEIGREMYVSGNFAVPHLNDHPFMEKPPLMPALTALAFYAAGGASETIARVPSTLVAFAMLLGVMLIARRIGGWKLGAWAGLITASSFQFFIYSHQSSIDVLLATCVTFTMLLFMRVYEPGKTQYSYRSLLPFYIFAVLAFYAKGFIGLVFPGLAVVALLAVNRDWRAFWRLKPWFGAIVFIALTLPWFAELWRQGRTEYLKIFFIDNHLDRFFKTAHSHLGHQHDPWYDYFVTIWKHFRPWSYLMPFAAVTAYRRLRDRDQSALAVRELTAWLLAGLGFLTLSTTKRDIYLLPLLPPVTIMVAMLMEERTRFSLELKAERWFDWTIGVFLALTAVIFPVWIALQKGGSRWAVLAIAPALGPAAAALYYLARNNRARFYPLFWSGAWVMTLACSLFFIPFFSSDTDHSPFARGVNQLTPGAKVFYTDRVREKESGYIGFYTGKTLISLNHIKDWTALARSQQPLYVLMMNSTPEEVSEFEQSTEQRGVDLQLMLREPGPHGGALWHMTPGAPNKISDRDAGGVPDL